MSWARRRLLLIPEPERLKQDGLEFETSLGYLGECKPAWAMQHDLVLKEEEEEAKSQKQHKILQRQLAVREHFFLLGMYLHMPERQRKDKHTEAFGCSHRHMPRSPEGLVLENVSKCLRLPTSP